MAKKNDTIDESIYVKQLVKAGMPEADAKAGVSKLVARINELMASDPVNERSRAVSVKIKELIAASKADKIRAIVIAASPRFDGNEYIRNSHIAEYTKDADTALSQGLVKVIKGEVVAIDNKKFWDEAGTKKNFGYGKPYPIRMRRDIIAIVDGSITKISGDINVVPGGVYDVFGKASANGTIYANAEPAPKLVDKLGASDFYDKVFNAAKSSEIAMDVDGALETNEKGTIIVKGFVHTVTVMSNGKHKMVISDEVGNSFSVFPLDDVSEKSISDAIVGTDAIAIGRIRDSKDPQYGRQMNAMYVVVNPKVGSVGKALDELADFEF